MDHLALFPPMAVALPGIHGTFVASLLRGPPRFREAPIAIKQERPREFGQPQIQRRENAQLVPEDVAAVRLPVQSARWDAGLEVGTSRSDPPARESQLLRRLNRSGARGMERSTAACLSIGQD